MRVISSCSCSFCFSSASMMTCSSVASSILIAYSQKFWAQQMNATKGELVLKSWWFGSVNDLMCLVSSSLCICTMSMSSYDASILCSFNCSFVKSTKYNSTSTFVAFVWFFSSATIVSKAWIKLVGLLFWKTWFSCLTCAAVISLTILANSDFISSVPVKNSDLALTLLCSLESISVILLCSLL